MLIGRKNVDSQYIDRPYRTHRFSMFFQKGFLFYAEYQLRLFFRLLFEKADVYIANDLDTLLANYLASRIRRRHLIYDSHELFTEVPELQGRNIVKKTWETIEAYIFPKLKTVYTVNDRIAGYYLEKYGVQVEVVRNLAPALRNKSCDMELAKKLKSARKMLLLQGSGINQDRGAEEAVLMMNYLKGYVLYIIGGGDVFPELKKLIQKNDLEERVKILPRMDHPALMEYTKVADLGLSLDKDSNLNYRYSLPNKLFDYMQCNVPILCSGIPQVAEIVVENNIGKVLKNHDPEEMARAVQNIFDNPKLIETWKQNLKRSVDSYSWEKEIPTLERIYASVL